MGNGDEHAEKTSRLRLRRQPTATPVQVAALKLPTFWPSDPELWFAQVEAQFATRGITKQLTTIFHVVTSLSPDVAAEVRDLVVNRPESSPYDELRAELIRRTSLSESKKLQQLISAEELGDRKPSQLLRHMRQLLGEKPQLVGDNFLTDLFVHRLPANIRVVLASSIDDTPLDKLAQLNDKMLEASDHTSVHRDNAASLSVVTQPVSTLASEVSVLKQEVSNLNSALQELQDGLQPVSANDSRYRRGANHAPAVIKWFSRAQMLFLPQAKPHLGVGTTQRTVWWTRDQRLVLLPGTWPHAR